MGEYNRKVNSMPTELEQYQKELQASAQAAEAEGVLLPAAFEKKISGTTPLGVRFEKAWHRHAAVLYANGTAVAVIAAVCDVEPQAVYNVIRAPWFQNHVKTVQSEGQKDILQLFKDEGLASLATLIELRDNKEAPSSVRLASAVNILDRVMGKPTQKIEQDVKTRSDDPVAEAEALEREVLQRRETLLRHTAAHVEGAAPPQFDLGPAQ